MKRVIDKKGLSPVVASSLLILLVIFLALLVFMWAKGFINEEIEKMGGPIEDQCPYVSLDIGIVGDDTVRVRNTGNIDIYSLGFKKIKGGESEYSSLKWAVPSQENINKSTVLKMSDGTMPEEVIFYPVLIGSSGETNKPFTCTDYGITVTI